jgi:hypothetical protein
LVTQANFKLTILLSQPSECWDYRHAPCPALILLSYWVLIDFHE